MGTRGRGMRGEGAGRRMRGGRGREGGDDEPLAITFRFLGLFL